MKRYSSTGIVWGNLWGGGQSGYSAKKLSGPTLKSIKEQALKGIKEGSLDSGMGYESLIGAVLLVKKEDVKNIKDREYIHTSYRPLVVGKIKPKIRRFLEELE